MLEVVRSEKVAYHAPALAEATLSRLEIVGDDAGENARAIIEQLRNESAAYIAIAEAKARSAIQREAQRHTQAWVASVKAGTQIDIGRLLADDDLVQLLSIKSEEFVGLIRSLSSDTIQRIERQVLGSIFEGRSNADIAKALREIEGIGLNRAKLIARDQASKLNAAMNEFRQGQAGVEKFKWKTILDGRERASHHAKNGKVFKWADPVEKPGQAVNCRCRALAVLEEYEDASSQLESGSPEPAADLPAGEFGERLTGAPRPIEQARAEGRAFVTSQGKKTGHEWGYVHDEDGRPLARMSSGSADFVAIDRKLVPEIYDPKRSLTFHHNHPGGGSFSEADIRSFDVAHGMKTLFAHAEEGSLYRVEVLQPGRAAVTTKQAGELAVKGLREALVAGRISHDDANRIVSHVQMLIVHKRGRVRYAYSLAGRVKEAAERNAELIDEVVADAVYYLSH